MHAWGASGGPIRRAWMATSFFLQKLLPPGGVEGAAAASSSSSRGVGYNYAGVSGWAARCGVERLEDLEAVLFPVHFEKDRHWGLAALDLVRREAHFWDSWWRGGREREEDVEALWKGCVRWAEDEAKKSGSGGASFSSSQWSIHIHKDSGVPQQENFCDCGE